MVDKINLPLTGPVSKKAVYIGGAITAGILGVAYWRHRQAANAAAASAAAPVTGSGVDPNTIDPNTGIPYSEEDASGQISGLDGGVSGYGGSYYGNGNIVGYSQDGQPIYGTGIIGSNVYTTNSEWATAAEDQLATIGVDTATAATAISRVLAGLSVTQAQQDLFMEAVGQVGQPPQGYPTPIKLVTTAQTTPGGTTTAGGGAPKYASNPPSGLHAVQVSTNFAEVQWDAVQGAKSYTVKTSPGGQFTTANTIANLGNLKRRTKYTVQVWANPTQTGGPHATVTFTTK